MEQESILFKNFRYTTLLAKTISIVRINNSPEPISQVKVIYNN